MAGSWLLITLVLVMLSNSPLLFLSLNHGECSIVNPITGKCQMATNTTPTNKNCKMQDAEAHQNVQVTTMFVFMSYEMRISNVL